MNRYAKLQSKLDRYTTKAIKSKGLIRKIWERKMILTANKIGKLMNKSILEVLA